MVFWKSPGIWLLHSLGMAVTMVRMFYELYTIMNLENSLMFAASFYERKTDDTNNISYMHCTGHNRSYQFSLVTSPLKHI